jgi:hypothetical protein
MLSKCNQGLCSRFGWIPNQLQIFHSINLTILWNLQLVHRQVHYCTDRIPVSIYNLSEPKKLPEDQYFLYYCSQWKSWQALSFLKVHY